MNLPIQQLQMYEMCPIGISIAGYFGIKFATKLAVYFMTAGFSALCAVALKSPLAANAAGMLFGVGGQIISLFYFLGTSYGGSSLFPSTAFSGESGLAQYDTVRTILPHGLLNISKYLEKFDCFDLFGFPVSRLFFCIAFTVVLLLIFWGLAYFKITRIEKAVR